MGTDGSYTVVSRAYKGNHANYFLVKVLKKGQILKVAGEKLSKKQQ